MVHAASMCASAWPNSHYIFGHAGLLNAAAEHIDGFPPLVHRWCMRHFAANFWRRQQKQEVCDKVKAICCVRTEHQFKETKRELDEMVNEAGKAWLEA